MRWGCKTHRRLFSASVRGVGGATLSALMFQHSATRVAETERLRRGDGLSIGTGRTRARDDLVVHAPGVVVQHHAVGHHRLQEDLVLLRQGRRHRGGGSAEGTERARARGFSKREILGTPGDGSPSRAKSRAALLLQKPRRVPLERRGVAFPSAADVRARGARRSASVPVADPSVDEAQAGVPRAS